MMIVKSCITCKYGKGPRENCKNCKGYSNWVSVSVQKENHITASDLLNQAANTLAERGKQYDKPEGERSMAAIVTAFNAITKRDMTEAEGWEFMCVLKQVRAFTGDTLHADSMLDLIAYSSLLAESADLTGTHADSCGTK